MKRNLLPLMFFGAFALLAIAIAVDCVRLANDARGRVRLADAELKKHEDRLAKLLADSPQATPEVKSAVAAYGQRPIPQLDTTAYEALVTSFRQTMEGKLDATNPLDRKVHGRFRRRDQPPQCRREALRRRVRRVPGLSRQPARADRPMVLIHGADRREIVSSLITPMEPIYFNP